METPSPWAETQTVTDAMETCLKCVCLSGTPCYFWFSSLLHTNAVLFFLFTMLLCFILLYSILLRQDWVHYVAQETTQCCCLATSPNWSYRHEKHFAQLFTRYWDQTLIFRLAQLALYPYSHPFRPLVCIPYSAFWNLLLMISDSL